MSESEGTAEAEQLRLGNEVALAGEGEGEGPVIVLCHGLTATRRQVVHGSRVLPRGGYRMVSYDARGHGDSDPAPQGSDYGNPQLVGDLAAVLADVSPDRPVLLAGHSMGAHTIVAYALQSPERVAGLVVIGPVFAGTVDRETRERALERWDALADGLEGGGVDGFVEAVDRQGLDPAWRETVLRFTRERMLAHRHPEAVAQALRDVPRSPPFQSMDELDFLDLPALVVASHDVADPGHPYAVAEAYAQHLPLSRLISEAEGESPLAWQGGRLSREIATFAEQDAVRERLGPSA